MRGGGQEPVSSVQLAFERGEGPFRHRLVVIVASDSVEVTTPIS